MKRELEPFVPIELPEFYSVKDYVIDKLEQNNK